MNDYRFKMYFTDGTIYFTELTLMTSEECFESAIATASSNDVTKVDVYNIKSNKHIATFYH